MTIQQYADLYRAAARATKSERLRKTYTETAQVLEAQAKAFNQLYDLVKSACTNDDLAPLREFVIKLESAKETLKQEFRNRLRGN